MREALIWYIVVQVAGLAVWPLVARAAAPLDDRGWAISKTAGLLGTAWLVWVICMLTPVPFARASLLLALVSIGAIGWLGLRREQRLVQTGRWLRAHARLLLVWEALF